MQLFHNRNIGFKSIQEHIDTTTSGGKLFFHIFAAIAEFERDIIRERTLSGLKAARARGKIGGRPFKLTSSQIQMVKNLYNDKSNSLDDICEMFKISRSTLYRTISS